MNSELKKWVRHQNNSKHSSDPQENRMRTPAQRMLEGLRLRPDERRDRELESDIKAMSDNAYWFCTYPC